MKIELAPAEYYSAVPTETSAVSEDIVGKIFGCVTTGKSFKIEANKIRLLKKLILPLPNIHPLERIKARNSYLK